MNSPTKGVTGRTNRRRKGNAPDVSHPVRRRRVGCSQLRPLCGQAGRTTGGGTVVCARTVRTLARQAATVEPAPLPLAGRGLTGGGLGERPACWGSVCPCRPLRARSSSRSSHPARPCSAATTRPSRVMVIRPRSACMYRVHVRVYGPCCARRGGWSSAVSRRGCQGAVCPLRPVLRRVRPGRREQHARTRRPAVLGQGHVLAGLVHESDQAAEVLEGVRQFDTVDGRDAADRRALAVSRS